MPTHPHAPRGVIAPGQLFVDDQGAVAQLHGVGIQRFGGRFYAWGEDKTSAGTFGGVACYSSPDLATWTAHGHALAVSPDVPDLAPGRVVERPKVLRNPDGKFVMFLHVDSADYAYARVGWAVAERPEGPYTYLRSERPLGNISRDIGVFVDHDGTDDDGTGYLLSEDREHGLHIYRLSADYLAVEEIVATTLTPPSDHPAGPHGYESPALVKVDGLYYLFGSELTGWSTNDNKVATASSPAGPWSDWADFAPSGSATYDSQTSTIVTVQGSQCTSHVYVGDRWDRDDLFHSAPVWLPVRIADGAARLEWRDAWTVDPVTGVIA
ncbi:Glycosyl hydrolases family 43 [Promicromonospora umidemergens]|uniref:Family 43 glycosylhydrolase n=1 Tax=Promicromonospora umidemergens TaxID=629679 RepID=A0ABP8WJ66_9MICO|nr:family 43 glycosylhydrolase [Promicromonospora umidemergens]MCP2283846.1 Glycosyl hydrolases family 43 [Promicromonospora umidemergens]